MKNYIFNLITFLFLIYVPSFFPQNLIEMLNDPNISVRRDAIYTIINGNLQEYIPNIEEAMFNQNEPFMIYFYLDALDELNSENIIEDCYNFITYSDNFENMIPAENPLEMKVEATIFLFNAGDYSTVQYIFDIVNRDKPDVNPFAILLLGRILNELPSYFETAKNELQYIMNNSPNESSRFDAMLFLSIYTGSEFITDYANKFLNDEDMKVRDQALRHLFSLDYSNLRNLLLQQLSAEPSEIIRAEIADSLLSVFSEPGDLKAVIDYQPNEPDSDINAWMQNSKNNFIPPRPGENISAYDMTNNLKSYTTDCYNYRWITTMTKYNSYLGSLNIIAKDIQKGDITSAIAHINSMLSQVEFDYNNTLSLLIEGYKFLHYHLIYIKDKLQ